MKFYFINWKEIIISVVLLLVVLNILSYISEGIPPLFHVLLSIAIISLLNRPKEIFSSIITGILIGVISGLFLSFIFIDLALISIIFMILIGIIGCFMGPFVEELFQYVFKRKLIKI